MSSNTALQVTKATAKTLDFILRDDTGAIIDLTGVTLITFVVKEQTSDSATALITKNSNTNTDLKIIAPATDGHIQVYLIPSDSNTLATKQYVYKIKVDNLIPINWSLFELKDGDLEYTPPTFTNTVILNQDTGGTDALRYMTAGSSPVEGAQIRVYYKTDYDAGNRTTPLAITLTNSYGRWTNDIHVFTGYTYVIEFMLTNQYGPDTAEVTV